MLTPEAAKALKTKQAVTASAEEQLLMEIREEANAKLLEHMRVKELHLLEKIPTNALVRWLISSLKLS